MKTFIKLKIIKTIHFDSNDLTLINGLIHKSVNMLLWLWLF